MKIDLSASSVDFSAFFQTVNELIVCAVCQFATFWLSCHILSIFVQITFWLFFTGLLLSFLILKKLQIYTTCRWYISKWHADVNKKKVQCEVNNETPLTSRRQKVLALIEFKLKNKFTNIQWSNFNLFAY